MLLKKKIEDGESFEEIAIDSSLNNYIQNQGLMEWKKANEMPKLFSEAIKNKNNIIEKTTIVKVVKNKVSPQFKIVEFDLINGKGISKSGKLIDLGSKADIVEKSGTWYA